MRGTKLDAGEILVVLEAAIENGIAFQVNFHNIGGLEAAIESAEKIGGGHKSAVVTQQTTCFVVSTEADRGEVSFFVAKDTAMPAETPFD